MTARVSVDERIVLSRQAPNRCPFCHEGCEVDDAVVCQDCLARHHAGCWSESGRCAACSSERSLAPAPGPRPRVVAALEAAPGAQAAASPSLAALVVTCATTAVAAYVVRRILSRSVFYTSYESGHPVESARTDIILFLSLVVPFLVAASARALTTTRHAAIALAVVVGAGALSIEPRGLWAYGAGALIASWVVVSVVSGGAGASLVALALRGWHARARSDAPRARIGGPDLVDRSKGA